MTGVRIQWEKKTQQNRFLVWFLSRLKNEKREKSGCEYLLLWALLGLGGRGGGPGLTTHPGFSPVSLTEDHMFSDTPPSLLVGNGVHRGETSKCLKFPLVTQSRRPSAFELHGELSSKAISWGCLQSHIFPMALHRKLTPWKALSNCSSYLHCN